jgi:uncharacterized protein
MTIREEVVEGIPAVLVTDGEPRGDLVIWLSHLGGAAEKEMPMLERFAAAGHPAVSFHAPGHGPRGEMERHEFGEHVFADFRRRMWPLLGQATLESMRVLDWAAATLDRDGPVLAGGVSMGGDIAIALAGIDDRVRRVATVGSSPDWSRPGMREIGGDESLLDQGEADRYAQWFADQLDPIRHLDRYRRGVAIDFELGAEDHHIQARYARDFAAALTTLDPTAAARIRVQVHPGLDHGVIVDPEALDAAFGWLAED